MAFWRRRQKSLDALPSISSDEHRWTLAQGDHDGAPLIIRFNSSIREWVGHKELGIKLGFAVPLNAPNEGGLPHPDENEQLNGIEDVIVREVEASAKGVFVLVLTTGVMREFVFYITEGADIKAMHEAIQKAVSTHEVQCMAVRDPDWDAYTQFTPS